MSVELFFPVCRQRKRRRRRGLCLLNWFKTFFMVVVFGLRRYLYWNAEMWEDTNFVKRFGRPVVTFHQCNFQICRTEVKISKSQVGSLDWHSWDKVSWISYSNVNTLPQNLMQYTHQQFVLFYILCTNCKYNLLH